MSTTSYPAFEADQTRLPPLVAPVPDKVTEAQSGALKDVEPNADANGLRAQARKVKGSWKLCATPRRSLTLATKWKNANRSIGEACRALSKTSGSSAARSEQLTDNSSLLQQALSA